MTICHLHASGMIEQYFYGELDATGRAEVQQHVTSCADCRQCLEDLRTIRVALASRPDVSTPPGGDWSGFMARLTDAIRPPEDIVDGVTASRWSSSLRYIRYASMAALLTLVTASLAYVARSRPGTPAETSVVRDHGESGIGSGNRLTTATARIAADDRAFASLSEQHFERSKLVVFGIANKDPREMAADEWAYERQLASALLNDTRLYRRAAEDRGLESLARVMGDLEMVLLQTALSSDPEPSTLQQIQSLIRKRDLVSKMEVVAAGL